MVKVADYPELSIEFSTTNSKTVFDDVYRNTKLDWVCPKGHLYNSLLRNRINGSGCPYCSNNKVLPGYNDLQTLFPDIAKTYSESNTVPVDQVAPKSGKKVSWDCPKGHVYVDTPNHRTLMGTGCQYCSGKQVLQGFNDLATLYPESVKLWDTDEFGPNEVTAGSNKTATWKCSNGHSYSRKVRNSVKNNFSCSICNNTEFVPPKEIYIQGVNDFASSFPEILDQWCSTDINPATTSKGSDRTVHWKCPLGHEFDRTVRSNVSLKFRCPTCVGSTILPGFNDISTTDPDIAIEISPKNTQDITKISRGSKIKLLWECSKGHEWEATPYARTGSGKTGCPKCANQQSKPESELLSYIESIYDGDVITKTRSVCSPYEIDIYLPELKLGIEFNGLFWHSERYREPNYHKNKSDIGRDNGVDIVHIWEDQWKYRQDIVKSFLRYRMGLCSAKVYARATSIDPDVSQKEAGEFLELNHIQGNASGSIRIGLRHKGLLVALSVLKRTGNVLRLERYATNLNVVGGHSKIISYIESNLDYTYIETFADLSISNGNLYEATGWSQYKLLPPDYMYVIRDRRSHKFNFRKSKFKNNPNLLYKEGLTEYELAKLNKLYRIWDCGKIKYIKEKPNDIKH